MTGARCLANLFWARLPNTDLRVLAAIDEVRQPGIAGCEHVPSSPVAMVCVDHAQEGVRCVDCATRHGSAHGDELECSCDECGTVDLDANGISAVVEMRTCPRALLVECAGVGGIVRFDGLAIVHSVRICHRCSGTGAQSFVARLRR